MRTAWLFVVGGMCPLNAIAQNVSEVQKPEISFAYDEVTDRIHNTDGLETDAAIELLTRALPEIEDPLERFDIIFWEVAFRYAELERYEEAFEVLRGGQREGLFYPLDDRAVPFLTDLRQLDGFLDFEEQNGQLRDESQANAKTGYFVQLPEGYSSDRAYPLLMVFHGGWGNHLGLLANWHSPGLDAGFIVAYVQGPLVLGTNLRSYVSDDSSDLVAAYRQITRDYSVDTARVVLGGQSAGGARSLSLALGRSIPATGLLLAFPVVPRDLTDDAIQRAADEGMGVAMICGEDDWGLPRQKSFSVRLDQHELPNRFIVFPQVGHGFPPGFSQQIDLSLAFLGY